MEISVDKRLLKKRKESNRDNNFSGKRYTVFFPGAPGSGKSTAASDFIKYFFPPDVVVYVYSIQKAERSYRFHKNQRKVKMIPEVIENISMDLLRRKSGNHPIVCLFDDVDKLSPDLHKPVHNLIEDLIVNG